MVDGRGDIIRADFIFWRHTGRSLFFFFFALFAFDGGSFLKSFASLTSVTITFHPIMKQAASTAQSVSTGWFERGAEEGVRVVRHSASCLRGERTRSR